MSNVTYEVKRLIADLKEKDYVTKNQFGYKSNTPTTVMSMAEVNRIIGLFERQEERIDWYKTQLQQFLKNQ